MADVAVFEWRHIRFVYPTSWTPEVEESDEGVSVVLQSPGVSFAILGVYPEEEDPADLIDQAVSSLSEEHPGLEREDVFEGEGDWRDAAGAEITFMSIDTVSYAWLRSGRVGGQSLLVFFQTIDPEAETTEAIFAAICRSVAATD